MEHTVALFSNVGGTVRTSRPLCSMMRRPRRSPAGRRRLPGSFQPTGQLSTLVGKNASGTWTLQIVNASQNTTGVLVNWSLNITPQITVTPLDVPGQWTAQTVSRLASRFRS